MSQAKPLVFISHITEEKEVALAFKKLVENYFLGMLEVFVSSDHDSIHMGQKWLDQVSNGLKTCAIEILLCSHQSIKRPWINFEAGAAWVRDIPVIPLCHSGIKPSQLPMPLNLLQAATANEISSLKLIFPVLAHAIGAKTPNVDFSDFIAEVKDFEQRYTFWDACNSCFEKINGLSSEIIPRLKNGNPVQLELSETHINLLTEAIKLLPDNQLVTLNRTGGVSMGGHGVTHGYTLFAGIKLPEIFSDPHFNF